MKEMEEIGSKFSGREKLQKLRDLRRELIIKVKEIEHKRNEIRDKRDKENLKAKKYFDEARIIREKRDKINEDVKLNKSLRGLSKENIASSLNELKKLSNNIKELGLDPRDTDGQKNIMGQIQDLEMEIVTTGNLNPDKEKQIVNEILQLGQNMASHEAAAEIRGEIRLIQERLENFRSDGQVSHEEVVKLSNQGQELHEEMETSYKIANEINEKSDKIHQEFIATSEQINEIRNTINDVSREIDKTRKDLGIDTSEQKKFEKKEKELKKKKVLDQQYQEVLAKYKSGEKLGYAEIKLLIDRGDFKSFDQSK